MAWFDFVFTENSPEFSKKNCKSIVTFNNFKLHTSSICSNIPRCLSRGVRFKVSTTVSESFSTRSLIGTYRLSKERDTSFNVGEKIWERFWSDILGQTLFFFDLKIFGIFFFFCYLNHIDVDLFPYFSEKIDASLY